MAHKFELVGVNAGKTVVLGGYEFVDGVYTYDSPDETVAGLTTYLARCYNAHPVGSADLEQAKADYETEQSTGKTIVREGAPQKDNDVGPKQTVVDAINSLDHENDAHWTEAGLPSVDAVADLAGERVTRAAIEGAAPGFNRAAAKAAATL